MTALLCAVLGTASAVTVTDVLTRDVTGATGNSYIEWSGKQLTSDAIYAGQSAGGNEAIQLRSNNSNSGIITTASGGKLKSVTVTWNSNTVTGRTLNIYGSNTAYVSPENLYDNNSCGELLGTIVCGTSTKLEIDGDYTYIGLRSASGAMYLDDISIVWDSNTTPTPVAPNAPTFSPEGGTYYAATTVTLACNTPGATIHYTLNGTNPTASSSTYTEPIEITQTTTIKAIAAKDGLTSSVASATYTIEVAATLPNIAALTSQTSGGDYTVKLDKAVVTYVNGNYAYIQDASGAIVLYKSEHGLTAGQTLTGTATVTFQLRNNNPQITALNGITPADGTAPEPVTVEAANWNTPIATVLSQYFKVTGATITKKDSKYYVQLGEENVQLYGQGEAKNFSVSDLSVKYTIIGFPTLYNDILELQIFQQPIPEGNVKEDPELDFGVKNFTAIIGKENAFPTLDNPNEVEVTYSSANEEVATIDETNGTITLLKAGQTTIKAVSEENDQYLAGEASYLLVVQEEAIAGTTKFELVDDATTIAVGDEIIIVNEEKTFALSTTQNTNNRAATAVTLEADGTIIPSNQVQVITIEGGEESIWNFNVGDGYLYAAGKDKNWLRTETEASGNAAASIIIDENGVATITFQGENTRNTIRYNANNGAPIFSCYATDAITGTPVRIYRSTAAPKAPADLTYSAEEYEATKDGENTFPVLNNPNGLDVTYTSSNETVATIDAEGVVTLIGAGQTTITAEFSGNDEFYAGSAFYILTVIVPTTDNDDKFELVTDIATLAEGDEIIFVGENTITDEEENSITSYYGLSTNQKANNREAVAVKYNADGTITGNNKLQTITLEGDVNGWYFNVGNGYLYAASKDKNYLRTETEADDNAKAIISKTETETEEGTVSSTSIVFQGANTRNVLQFNYNNGSPLFSCYSSASQKEVKIYRKNASGFLLGDANDDGQVNVTDVTVIVNYVLTKDATFINLRNANMNNDFKEDGTPDINITDVTFLVNLILEAGGSH